MTEWFVVHSSPWWDRHTFLGYQEFHYLCIAYLNNIQLRYLFPLAKVHYPASCLPRRLTEMHQLVLPPGAVSEVMALWLAHCSPTLWLHFILSVSELFLITSCRWMHTLLLVACCCRCLGICYWDRSCITCFALQSAAEVFTAFVGLILGFGCWSFSGKL